jgi:glucosyl-dolichyl phosphate glucuronosyltransferase
LNHDVIASDDCPKQLLSVQRTPMTSMTVAIPTWNRATLLDQTLTQLHRLRIPSDVEWELLVVNNNCSDQTDATIFKHANHLPIRRLFEPTPGCASARNLAVAEARGEWILWTDDDVLVSPEWLAAYHEASKRWPDAGYFAGLIEPWFECDPPAWVLENTKVLEGVLAIRNFGPDEHRLSESEIPWSANMAVRKELFKDTPFDPTLGATKDGGYLGDEVKFIESLQSRGILGAWVPRARVRHFIPKRRLDRAYVWKHFHRYGQTLGHLEGIPSAGVTWLGAPRWLIRQAFEQWIVSIWKRMRNETDWFTAYSRAATTWGMLVEARRQAKRIRMDVISTPAIDVPPTAPI